MKKALFSAAIAATLLAGIGVATAQTSTTTTTTWTTDQGKAIREYSTTKNYTSYSDTTIKPSVGVVLPPAVTVYPLPETVKVQTPNSYSYSIVNNQPVVIERSSRRIVHTWD